MKPLSDAEKHAQCVKEMKATLILLAIVAIWHIGTAFLLNGIERYILGMPLWFFVSTPGAFLISVVGVVYLIKKVFIDFDLGEEEPDSAENEVQL